MVSHPLTENQAARWRSIALAAGVVVILAAFAHLYCGFTPAAALIASFAYVSIVAASGYFYWFVSGYIKKQALTIAISVIVQLIALSLALLGAYAAGAIGSFAYAIPGLIIIGVLCWIILLMWYSARRDINNAEAIIDDMISDEEEQKKRDELIERISVKNGSKLNIIKVENLHYIQAYGDYVFLFTSEGRFLKEQTMKSFEEGLPPNFIRIHRSYIVNSEMISRIEAYGKETYTVMLKDGSTIRASATGYKLLRRRLSL